MGRNIGLGLDPQTRMFVWRSLSQIILSATPILAEKVDYRASRTSFCRNKHRKYCILNWHDLFMPYNFAQCFKERWTLSSPIFLDHLVQLPAGQSNEKQQERRVITCSEGNIQRCFDDATTSQKSIQIMHVEVPRSHTSLNAWSPKYK